MLADADGHILLDSVLIYEMLVSFISFYWTA